MSKTLLCINVSFQRCKLCCHWTEYKAASSDACLLLFFFSRGAKGDSGPISLFFCHTLSLLKGLYTHIYPTPPPYTDAQSQQRVDITSALRW